MKRIVELLICAAIISQYGIAFAQELSAGPQLTKDKKARLEVEALKGSARAAREIALFHGTRDDDLMEYWSWIGAENGDPICQHNYASILLGKADEYSRMRGIYWLKKAARNGVDVSAEHLKSYDDEGRRRASTK
jgi:hypothetical protein